MGKGSPSAPAQIDPAASAKAQGLANKEAVRESALVNQINTRGPFGDVTFSGEVGKPDRTQTLTLPPEVQAILDSRNQVGGDLSRFAADFAPRVAEGLATPFNTSSVGPAPVADPQERQRIEQSLFARLEPLIDRDRDRLASTLANQGISVGSDAFSDAQDDFGRGVTDARLASVNQAGNEFARSFGLENQAFQQRLSNELLNRTQGLNEVSALLQGSPAIQTPQVQQPAQFQIAPGDFQGAQALNSQIEQNRFNSELAQQNSIFGGLAGLGGSLGSAAIFNPSIFSDERVKTNVKRVGKMDDGTPIYTYNYVWGGPVHMGVMAQELERVNPAAVHEIGGIKAVDYGAL